MLTSPPPLKVGRIPFLVCAPYFHSTLDTPLSGIEFVDAPPRAQNAALAQGVIHCSPSSSIAYAQHPQDLWILPEICTGSTLEIRSVKLFSNYPLSELSHKTIGLTVQSDTSVVLLKLLLEQWLGLRPQWISHTSPDCEAVLLIGDQALQESQKGLWKFEYDLASLWQEWQQLPFVFGMWLVHDSVVRWPLIQQFQELMHQSIADFRATPNQALEHWLTHYPQPFPLHSLTDYFQQIEYRFTEAHQAGLRQFFQLASQGGYILGPAPQLRFI